MIVKSRSLQYLATATFLLGASILSADTVESVPFLAEMTSAQEVGSTATGASADALIWVHIIRDDAGNIKSGSVDFNVRYRFPGAVTVTGLHIHNGPAGVNAGIVIPTDVGGGAASIAVDQTGRGTVFKQVNFPTSTATPALIQDLLTNPQNYYVNMHTTDFPGGAMRSQLYRADMKILMAQMSPANEVPPIPNSNASGVPTVVALRAFDSAGKFSSAWVTFILNYQGFPSDTVFTGFHIHSGGATVNGPVIINSGISGANSVPVGAGGSGSLTYDIPVSSADASYAAEVDVVNGLFSNPGGYYINIHTTVSPGGAMRSQLMNTDRSDFQVTMKAANENPPTPLPTASGPALLSLYNLRNADGTIAAGTVIFDVNYLGFPTTASDGSAAPVTFTGLHIHSGTADVNGPVVINTGLSAANSVTTTSGAGNVYKVVSVNADVGVQLMNTISQNPENAYVNIHTTVYSGGAIRSQLAPVITAMPAVGAITSNADIGTKTLAPGSVFTIFGTNLAKTSGDLNGMNSLSALPGKLNGVSVTVGGKAAALYFVSPYQINAQAPVDAGIGAQAVVVTSPNGAGASFNATFAAMAPAIYYDPASSTPAVIQNNDFSLVTKDRPAKAGDILLVYLTGLGQTTPPLQTGSLQAPTTLQNTAPVSVKLGGASAPVIYSIATPGLAGIYQIAFTVPTGVSGSSALVVTAGSAASNTVNVMVK
jgi:uncharacterized protein (TIGR03437 family)